MKLTERFGPIPVTTTLDGSGNGTVTFQTNGSNARVTNLFVKVSTTTAQAKCTIYKGQIADGNAINTTNSGSTGSAASGAIDLTDGEVLYVRWTGGDAGATATATFSGITIPFVEVGPSQLEWADPIAAGDGSLIYPALKSPNYVAGSAGWKIDRAGNAEFNDVEVRGTVDVRNASGAYVTIAPSATDVLIDINPPDSVNAGIVYFPGSIYSDVSNTVTDQTQLTIESPRVNAPVQHDSSFISLLGQTSAGGNSIAKVIADDVVLRATNKVYVAPTLVHETDGFVYLRGQSGVGNVSVAAVTGVNVTVPFPTAFPVGVTPIVFCNLDSGSGSAVGYFAKAISLTNTGFTARIQTSGAAATFNSTFSWLAFATL